MGAPVDGAHQLSTVDVNAGFLPKLTDGGAGQGIVGFDGPPDGEPIRRVGSGRVVAEKKQNLAASVDRQDASSLTRCG